MNRIKWLGTFIISSLCLTYFLTFQDITERVKAEQIRISQTHTVTKCTKNERVVVTKDLDVSLIKKPISALCLDISQIEDLESLKSAWIVNLEYLDVSHLQSLANLSDLISPNFNDPIGRWDVRKVKDMSYMFYNLPIFNQPLGDWNVSNVTDMKFAFASDRVPLGEKIRETLFDQPLDHWDVSKVKDMGYMFYNATYFTPPIGSWNVGQVKKMDNMFHGATYFNENIGNWNVSNVTNMDLMFAEALHFDQPIGNWNVSNVQNMNYMFSGASQFNQDLSQWCVSQFKEMPKGFDDNTDAWEEKNKPVWGTCPRGEDKARVQVMNSFKQCDGLPIVVRDKKHLRVVLNQQEYYDVNCLDMSHITNANGLLAVDNYQPDPELIDKMDIQEWDVSNIKNMSRMFAAVDNFHSNSFNAPLAKWDVGNVENMSEMFKLSAFNQPIQNWNVLQSFIRSTHW